MSRDMLERAEYLMQRGREDGRLEARYDAERRREFALEWARYMSGCAGR